MSPLLNLYQDAVKHQEIKADSAQIAAIQVLQRIWDELVAQECAACPVPQKAAPKGGFLSSLFAKPHAVTTTTILVRGAYIWGGVGRGKTWLMDLFFNHVPVKAKQRMHYHHFMSFVHSELKDLGNIRNPLDELVKRLAQTTRLLCIDEFHVLDIVDAMLLHGLLDALAKHGITLVTTSNRKPDDLYHEGLQRARFLPAIAILKRDTVVVELDNNVDYRMLKHIGEHRFVEADAEVLAERALLEQFEALAVGKIYTNALLNIHGRQIEVRKLADNIAWFGFSSLCDGPRSTLDYIEIAERYQVVMLSGVPILNEYHENAARRFLNLIDELYDRQVRLILSSAIPLNQLYQGEKLIFEYDRAMSRLNEMQSDEYQQQRAA